MRTDSNVRALYHRGVEQTQHMTIRGASCFFTAPVQSIASEFWLESLLSSLGDQVHSLVWAKQIHSTIIASYSPEKGDSPGIRSIGRCDGIICDVPGTALLVWTADCVPLLIAGGGAVAAIHAGWRGCAGGIALQAVRRFWTEYGVPAKHLVAVLGPAIGRCHYEVGSEVIEGLAASGISESAYRSQDHVDLRAFLHAQLVLCGLDRHRISSFGGCTFCEPGWASYRRDGDRAGRQASIIVPASDRVDCAAVRKLPPHPGLSNGES